MNNITANLNTLVPLAVSAITKVLLALVLWFVGRWLIGLAIGAAWGGVAGPTLPPACF